MYICSDCLNKSLGSVGGSGRYSCDECGKLFRYTFVVVVVVVEDVVVVNSRLNVY